MSTLESTISLIKVLPESDLIRIQNFAKELFQMHECETVDDAVGKSLKPMSREDIYKDLEISRQQIGKKEYRDAREFIAEARREYGI